MDEAFRELGRDDVSGNTGRPGRQRPLSCLFE